MTRRFFSKNSEQDKEWTVVGGKVPAPDTLDQAVEVSLADVIDSPFQPRLKPLTKGDVVDLMSAIAAAGQLSPIIASPAKEPGKLYVHSGHRRCAALRFLERTTVKAIVKPELSEQEARKIALLDNLGREDLTAYEQAVALRDFAAASDSSIERASQELGVNRRLAFRLKAILGASEELQALFRSTDIAAKPADLLAKIEAKNPRKVKRLLQKYTDGKITSVDLERENRSKKSARAPAAQRPVELRIDEQTVSLKIKIVKTACGDEERLLVHNALQELIREVGIPKVVAG